MYVHLNIFFQLNGFLCYFTFNLCYPSYSPLIYNIEINENGKIKRWPFFHIPCSIILISKNSTDPGLLIQRIIDRDIHHKLLTDQSIYNKGKQLNSYIK